MYNIGKAVLLFCFSQALGDGHMRDIDIRRGLRRKLARSEDADALIVEEYGLCQGEVRIDVAVVNGALNGYEIKSDCDTLERLPAQRDVYGQVLDTVTLVFSGQRLDLIVQQVPYWWGIWQAVERDGDVGFETVRQPVPNPSVVATSLVQCLWRDEAFSVLKEYNLHQGLERSPRRAIWERLAAALPLEDLKRIVRDRLKARQGWRPDSPPVSCGDLLQLAPKCQGCQN